jgi:hypothetical protein
LCNHGQLRIVFWHFVFHFQPLPLTRWERF